MPSRLGASRKSSAERDGGVSTTMRSQRARRSAGHIAAARASPSPCTPACPRTTGHRLVEGVGQDLRGLLGGRALDDLVEGPLHVEHHRVERTTRPRSSAIPRRRAGCCRARSGRATGRAGGPGRWSARRRAARLGGAQAERGGGRRLADPPRRHNTRGSACCAVAPAARRCPAAGVRAIRLHRDVWPCSVRGSATFLGSSAARIDAVPSMPPAGAAGRTPAGPEDSSDREPARPRAATRSAYAAEASRAGRVRRWLQSSGRSMPDRRSRSARDVAAPPRRRSGSAAVEARRSSFAIKQRLARPG
jgi:hypothetical protein